MNELDQNLEILRANPEDQKAQSCFYDLFLNTVFFLPTVKEMIQPDEESDEHEAEVPMVIESEGSDYLVFFDDQQRLNNWAQQDAPCIQLPGHVIAEMSTEELYWVMNLGTEHIKQFAPDEIAWLKDVVERCKAEAEK